jgi:hypothetical protein
MSKLQEHAYRGKDGKRILYVTDGDLGEHDPFQTDVEAQRSQDQNWGMSEQASQIFDSYNHETVIFLAKTHLPARPKKLTHLIHGGPDVLTRRLHVSQIRNLAVIYHSGGGTSGAVSIVDMQSLPGHIQTSEHRVVSIARAARMIRQSDETLPGVSEVLQTTRVVSHHNSK